MHIYKQNLEKGAFHEHFMLKAALSFFIKKKIERAKCKKCQFYAKNFFLTRTSRTSVRRPQVQVRDRSGKFPDLVQVRAGPGPDQRTSLPVSSSDKPASCQGNDF